jgi:ubiquinone biosynthesis monooxygenase Coq7
VRNLSFIDQLVATADNALRTLAPQQQATSRPTPAASAPIKPSLSESEKRHAAGLMRVNHSGEVCAQALYQGQAMTAKLPKVRQEMEHAAQEEVDHLAWCEDRLKALNSQPSLLNPLWYAVSFGIGAGAGLISDRLSLGFVAATEELVCEHLSSHLESLPQQDTASKAVVSQMLEDEGVHARKALEAGGLPFPPPVKHAMTLVSRVMTKASYHL